MIQNIVALEECVERTTFDLPSAYFIDLTSTSLHRVNHTMASLSAVVSFAEYQAAASQAVPSTGTSTAPNVISSSMAVLLFASYVSKAIHEGEYGWLGSTGVG